MIRDRARHARVYDLHSWSGIVLGLIIYVVAFTGSVALFHTEILTWEDPAKRLAVPAELAQITDTLDAWVADEAGGDEVTFLRFDYPTPLAPYYAALMVARGEDGQRQAEARWDANTADRLPERGAGLSEWLLDFHRDLMWPDGLGGRTVGRSLVGVVGVVLLLSIVSGVVAHTKIREEAFSVRVRRSVRLKWQDAHKVIGLWSLPFAAMIAFTGAFLGIVALLAPVVAAIAFKGDVESLERAVFGEAPERAGVAAEMVTLEEIGALRHPESGRAPERVILTHWGDEGAVFDVFFRADTELARYDTVSVDGVTGEASAGGQFGGDVTPAQRVTNAMSPLHYGNYGGPWLKLLYLALGLCLAVVTVLGMMMWIERRKNGRGGTRSRAFYGRLSAMNTGAIMGLPVATMALFAHDKAYAGSEDARLFWTGTTYFAVWGAGLAYSLLRRNDYAATRELMGLAGTLSILAVAVNGAVTGDWFWTGVRDGASHALVDLGLACLGLATLAVAAKLPAERREKARFAIPPAPLACAE